MGLFVKNNLNGTNLERDAGLSGAPKILMEGGVRKGFSSECLVTANNVAPGIVWIPCTRTTVTPNEQLMVMVEITTNEIIDTTGTGFVIVEINSSNITNGSSNPADGSSAAVLKVVSSLPADNFIELASVTASVITDTRSFIELTQKALPTTIYYGVGGGIADAYTVTVDGPKALTDGLTIRTKIIANNTGASTLAVNAFGAKPMVKEFNTALLANELKATQNAEFMYNSSIDSWQMLSQLGTTPAAATDEKAKVSAADTLSNFLDSKFAAGIGMLKAILNPAGDEDLEFAVDLPTAGSAGNTPDNQGTSNKPSRSDHGHKSFSGTVTPSAGTGSKAITGLGFKPKTLIIFAQSGGSAGKGSIGFAASSSSEFVYAWGDTTFAQITAGSIINTDNSGGTATQVASLTSFDADGFTLNYSLRDTATSIHFLAFA